MSDVLVGRAGKTQFTEQQILNEGLDTIDVHPLTSVRGGLVWAEGTTGSWHKVPIMGIHPNMQIEWSGTDPIYIGVNDSISASDDDTDWVIFKLTWSSHQLTASKQRITSWTDRATGW